MTGYLRLPNIALRLTFFNVFLTCQAAETALWVSLGPRYAISASNYEADQVRKLEPALHELPVGTDTSLFRMLERPWVGTSVISGSQSRRSLIGSKYDPLSSMHCSYRGDRQLVRPTLIVDDP
ncbi:hypothetical protein BC629DRAFT_1490307 [Irpex lacteus]|nr:hypothetical protein BC629DRAFT_1490307 [Irpex lacteus]